VHDYTYTQVRDEVAAVGTALFDQGLAGAHVAIVGDNSCSYVTCYLAVVCAGGVIVPLDKELTNGELADLIVRSGARALFYSDTLAADIPCILARCPEVRFALNITRYPTGSDNPLFEEFLARGRSLLGAGDDRFRGVRADPAALAAILFTSGTTGPSKGVMLSQQNIASVIHSAFTMFRFPRTGMSVLPINHAYEFNLNILGCLFDGITICFNDSIMHVRENLERFRPEMSLMVPMIVDALYKGIWKEAEKNHMTGYLRYAIGLSDALRHVGIDLRRAFFRPILEHFGGRLRVIVCGGAPLATETVSGLTSLGIDVYNGYGITECAPLISSNCTLRRVPGSVGIPCPDLEVRIADTDADGNGEIQVRGPHVMLGYYDDPAATAAAFTDDGWFRTGDLGRLGRRGALFITGRQKNLIILPNGKNVQPEEIEQALLCGIVYLKEVVVHELLDPSGAPRIAASAYLDPDWVNEQGSDGARVRFDADVATVNQRLASYKRICLTRLQEQEFEKTATRKIMRHRVEGALI
jgi:long-chain acyl-CoA synthetase